MSRGRWRRLRSPLLAALLALLRGLFGVLPWPLAQRLGAAGGRLGWRLGGRDRRRALDHLAIAFPAREPAARARLGRAAFAHLGTSVAELMHLLGRAPSEVRRHVRVDGFEHLEPLVAAGRPVVVVTGHCGNWELLAGLHPLCGLRLYGVQRRLDDPALDAAIVAVRSHLGAVNLPRGTPEARRHMLRVVRRGGALVLLIDQDLDTDGTWVPFFGRRAFTPLAAARLAKRLRAPVVPMFSERCADGSHRIRVEAPLELPADPTAATALMTAAIEAQIRRRPEQWVWMHRRWRRRPAGETA